MPGFGLVSSYPREFPDPLPPPVMPRYFIQNKSGEYLTVDALWSGDKKRAAGFDDVRGVLKICSREHLHEAQLVIDMPGDSICVPLSAVEPSQMV